MIRWFKSRRPTAKPVPNPAETLTPFDIHVKTLFGISTPDWINLTDQERADARNGVTAAHTERKTA